LTAGTWPWELGLGEGPINEVTWSEGTGSGGKGGRGLNLQDKRRMGERRRTELKEKPQVGGKVRAIAMTEVLGRKKKGAAGLGGTRPGLKTTSQGAKAKRGSKVTGSTKLA